MSSPARLKQRYGSDLRRAEAARAEAAPVDHTWTYIACAVALFACLMMYGGVKASLGERALLAHGVVASGTVTDQQVEHSRDDTGPSRTFYVSTTFTTQAGAVISGRHPVSEQMFRAVKPGQKVDVLYLPSRPDFNTLEPSTTWWMFAVVSVLLCLPFLFGSLWYLWTVWVRGRLRAPEENTVT